MGKLALTFMSFACVVGLLILARVMGSMLAATAVSVLKIQRNGVLSKVRPTLMEAFTIDLEREGTKRASWIQLANTLSTILKVLSTITSIVLICLGVVSLLALCVPLIGPWLLGLLLGALGIFAIACCLILTNVSSFLNASLLVKVVHTYTNSWMPGVLGMVASGASVACFFIWLAAGGAVYIISSAGLSAIASMLLIASINSINKVVQGKGGNIKVQLLRQVVAGETDNVDDMIMRRGAQSYTAAGSTYQTIRSKAGELIEDRTKVEPPKQPMRDFQQEAQVTMDPSKASDRISATDIEYVEVPDDAESEAVEVPQAKEISADPYASDSQ